MGGKGAQLKGEKPSSCLFISVVFFVFFFFLTLPGRAGQVFEGLVNRLASLLVTDGWWENVTDGQLNHSAP